MIKSIANLPEDVSLIPLTQNACAIVDTKNLRLLNVHRWNLMAQRGLQYARRYVGRKIIYMHREIMNAPNGMQVDHINGNGLDNRRVNLRICNSSQNQQNARKKKSASSQFKGVGRHGKKWRARICINYKKMYLGRYKSEFMAASAYDQKAVELFCEFANLNFPSLKTKLLNEKKQNESAGLP